MANVVVKDNHLTFGGVAYFRGNAEEIEIGSYGEKRTPLTKMNYLEKKGAIASKINVVTSTVVDIDFSKTSKSAFNTKISAVMKGVNADFSGDAVFEGLKSGKLKLVKFSALNNDIKAAANSSPAVLEDLRSYGRDARIAHQVFVVMEATLATKFDNDVSGNLSAEKGKLKVTVGGSHSSSGQTTIIISPGTGFAYLLLKIDWEKHKTKIKDLDDDQWSLS